VVLRSWSKTDVGRRREHNEDSLVDEPALGLFAVADGMGGHKGGAYASRLALKVLRHEVVLAAKDLAGAVTRLRRQASRGFARKRARPPTARLPRRKPGSNTVDLPIPDEAESPSALAGEMLVLAARKASFTVFEAARVDPKLRGMGTTLTALLFREQKVHLVHAGDSRAYLLRQGALRQLSEDHSWIYEQVKLGAISPEEARASRHRNVITRSIGFEREAEVDLRVLDGEPGDTYLLCSDGLSGAIDDAELGRMMGEIPHSALPAALIDLANQRGGEDNITAVVLDLLDRA
jgi:protein phosphatase